MAAIEPPLIAAAAVMRSVAAKHGKSKDLLWQRHHAYLLVKRLHASAYFVPQGKHGFRFDAAGKPGSPDTFFAHRAVKSALRKEKMAARRSSDVRADQGVKA
jgi:hypothetical protein